MKLAKRNTALAALLLIANVSTSIAAEDASSSNALRIASGPQGKVYELLVRDVQTVCGAETPIVNVPSVGGIPNLMMLSASQADLGIVQRDTLLDIGSGGDENVQNLQAVMPLHTNLLHVLALREGSRVGETKMPFSDATVPMTGTVRVMRKFSDLKNVKVAAVGSTMLLGQRLKAQLGYDIDLRKAETDDEAIKWLRENKVQAVFTDGGWPLPSVDKYTADSGLLMVEYDLPAQAPFSIVKRSYQKLSAFNVPFLGSPNLLVTRPFKPNGDIGKRVAALQSCLLKHMDELQEGRFHAAWKEIKTPTDTLGVPRFSRTANEKSSTR